MNFIGGIRDEYGRFTWPVTRKALGLPSGREVWAIDLAYAIGVPDPRWMARPWLDLVKACARIGKLTPEAERLVTLAALAGRLGR